MVAGALWSSVQRGMHLLRAAVLEVGKPVLLADLQKVSEFLQFKFDFCIVLGEALLLHLFVWLGLELLLELKLILLRPRVHRQLDDLAMRRAVGLMRAVVLLRDQYCVLVAFFHASLHVRRFLFLREAFHFGEDGAVDRFVGVSPFRRTVGSNHFEGVGVLPAGLHVAHRVAVAGMVRLVLVRRIGRQLDFLDLRPIKFDLAFFERLFDSNIIIKLLVL